MGSEKFTDRDLLIRLVDSQEEILQFFSNGKFVGQLKEGIKEQTTQIMKEFNGINNTNKEIKGVMNWIRYVAFGLIGALITADLALVGLYVREILLNK